MRPDETTPRPRLTLIREDEISLSHVHLLPSYSSISTFTFDKEANSEDGMFVAKRFFAWKK
jgi:hypothetical protein